MFKKQENAPQNPISLKSKMMLCMPHARYNFDNVEYRCSIQ